jgi:hypothetical protein
VGVALTQVGTVGTGKDEEVHYVCQRCANCCKWPGDVCLEEDDILRIAAFLQMDVLQFTAEYTRLRENRVGLSLIDQANNECIMLEDGKSCRIQPVKPKQCAGFPNTWNFPGWRDECEAVPVPLHRGGERGGT